MVRCTGQKIDIKLGREQPLMEMKGREYLERTHR